MGLKLEVKCDRCGRSHLKSVESTADGQKYEELQEKKRARLAEIAKFFEAIPEEELPDFMVVGSDASVWHSILCDPEEDGTRSCKKRVAELVKEAGKLPERKPKSPRKAKEAPKLDEKPADE